MSLSHWLEPNRALAASTRRVSFVARVELEASPLARVALTEQKGPGHVDVWANPHALLRATSDVVRHRSRP